MSKSPEWRCIKGCSIGGKPLAVGDVVKVTDDNASKIVQLAGLGRIVDVNTDEGVAMFEAAMANEKSAKKSTKKAAPAALPTPS